MRTNAPSDTEMKGVENANHGTPGTTTTKTSRKRSKTSKMTMFATPETLLKAAQKLGLRGVQGKKQKMANGNQEEDEGDLDVFKSLEQKIETKNILLDIIILADRGWGKSHILGEWLLEGISKDHKDSPLPSLQDTKVDSVTTFPTIITYSENCKLERVEGAKTETLYDEKTSTVELPQHLRSIKNLLKGYIGPENLEEPPVMHLSAPFPVFKKHLNGGEDITVRLIDISGCSCDTFPSMKRYLQNARLVLFMDRTLSFRGLSSDDLEGVLTELNIEEYKERPFLVHLINIRKLCSNENDYANLSGITDKKKLHEAFDAINKDLERKDKIIHTPALREPLRQYTLLKKIEEETEILPFFNFEERDEAGSIYSKLPQYWKEEERTSSLKTLENKILPPIYEELKKRAAYPIYELSLKVAHFLRTWCTTLLQRSQKNAKQTAKTWEKLAGKGLKDFGRQRSRPTQACVLFLKRVIKFMWADTDMTVEDVEREREAFCESLPARHEELTLSAEYSPEAWAMLFLFTDPEKVNEHANWEKLEPEAMQFLQRKGWDSKDITKAKNYALSSLKKADDDADMEVEETDSNKRLQTRDPEYLAEPLTINLKFHAKQYVPSGAYDETIDKFLEVLLRRLALEDGDDNTIDHEPRTDQVLRKTDQVLRKLSLILKKEGDLKKLVREALSSMKAEFSSTIQQGVLTVLKERLKIGCDEWAARFGNSIKQPIKHLNQRSKQSNASRQFVGTSLEFGLIQQMKERKVFHKSILDPELKALSLEKSKNLSKALDNIAKEKSNFSEALTNEIHSVLRKSRTKLNLCLKRLRKYAIDLTKIVLLSYDDLNNDWVKEPENLKRMQIDLGKAKTHFKGLMEKVDPHEDLNEDNIVVWDKRVQVGLERLISANNVVAKAVTPVFEHGDTIKELKDRLKEIIDVESKTKDENININFVARLLFWSIAGSKVEKGRHERMRKHQTGEEKLKKISGQSVFRLKVRTTHIKLNIQCEYNHDHWASLLILAALSVVLGPDEASQEKNKVKTYLQERGWSESDFDKAFSELEERWLSAFKPFDVEGKQNIVKESKKAETLGDFDIVMEVETKATGGRFVKASYSEKLNDELKEHMLQIEGRNGNGNDEDNPLLGSGALPPIFIPTILYHERDNKKQSTGAKNANFPMNVSTLQYIANLFLEGNKFYDVATLSEESLRLRRKLGLQETDGPVHIFAVVPRELTPAMKSWKRVYENRMEKYEELEIPLPVQLHWVRLPHTKCGWGHSMSHIKILARILGYQYCFTLDDDIREFQLIDQHTKNTKVASFLYGLRHLQVMMQHLNSIKPSIKDFEEGEENDSFWKSLCEELFGVFDCKVFIQMYKIRNWLTARLKEFFEKENSMQILKSGELEKHFEDFSKEFKKKSELPKTFFAWVRRVAEERKGAKFLASFSAMNSKDINQSKYFETLGYHENRKRVMVLLHHLDATKRHHYVPKEVLLFLPEDEKKLTDCEEPDTYPAMKTKTVIYGAVAEDKATETPIQKMYRAHAILNWRRHEDYWYTRNTLAFHGIRGFQAHTLMIIPHFWYKNQVASTSKDMISVGGSIEVVRG